MYKIDKYQYLMDNLLSSGLNFSTEWNKDDTKEVLFLRHDIDFSPEHALVIAKKEIELGIKSTYFFMFTSNMYNILSKKNQKTIMQIKKMGHKISFHFDPTAHKTLNQFLLEKDIMEKTFNIKVDIVSIHRPGLFLNDSNKKLFGISHTYEDKYFRNMKYLSDSGGRDVTPLIDAYLKNRDNHGLHLLIHPIWWCEEGESATSTLNKWKNNHIDFIKTEIRLNCKTYLD